MGGKKQQQQSVVSQGEKYLDCVSLGGTIFIWDSRPCIRMYMNFADQEQDVEPIAPEASTV